MSGQYFQAIPDDYRNSRVLTEDLALEFTEFTLPWISVNKTFLNCSGTNPIVAKRWISGMNKLSTQQHLLINRYCCYSLPPHPLPPWVINGFMNRERVCKYEQKNDHYSHVLLRVHCRVDETISHSHINFWQAAKNNKWKKKQFEKYDQLLFVLK